MRESVKVLQECIELQNKKGEDYQSSESKVRQADYYPRGLETLYDIVWAKMLRIRSVLDKGDDVNFESIEDSLKDTINYCSFMVSFLRGKMDGQPKKTPLTVDCVPMMSSKGAKTTPPIDPNQSIRGTIDDSDGTIYPRFLWRTDGSKFIKFDKENKYTHEDNAEYVVTGAHLYNTYSYHELMCTGAFSHDKPTIVPGKDFPL